MPFSHLSPQRRRRIKTLFAAFVVLVVLDLSLGVVNTFRLQSQVHDVATLTKANRALVHDVTQKNVTARYDDCDHGDEVRTALYNQAVASARTTPLLFQLVPQLDTPQVRELLAESRRQQLQAYQPRGVTGCTAYALSSVPPRGRAHFHVP